jgi:hypothetical protein
MLISEVKSALSHDGVANDYPVAVDCDHGRVLLSGVVKSAWDAKHAGDKIKFNGFDGNNETKHMNIARFLIKEMGHFTEFKDRGGYRGDINSHFPTLDVYRRMLSVFTPIRKKLDRRNLDAKEMVEIMKARTHPTMREKMNQ